MSSTAFTPEPADYASVTEQPGLAVTPEQLSMIYTRYHMAAGFSEGKDLLEVACGPGIGLGYLARKAKKVVGGDIDERLVTQAQELYKNDTSIQVLPLDAHKLTFDDKSFDVGILFEAIYYLAEPQAFLGECRRVLRPGGMLLICSANKECPEFVASPYSTRYFSATELSALLESGGFETELFVAFPRHVASARDKVVGFIKRAAAALNLIPGTLRLRAVLKRVFYGPLVAMPRQLDDGVAEPQELVPLTSQVSVADYRVFYAVARLR